MPQFTYPGVYIEELRRIAPIQGVSTSIFGAVGMAEKGPEDEATLITSFTQFQETFGDFISDSSLALQVYAFFANEGRQAYVVRVCRSDATLACGFVMNEVSDEVTQEDNPGGLNLATTNAPVPGTATPIANTPINPGSVSIKWYEQTVQPPAIPGIYTNMSGAIEQQVQFRLNDGAGTNLTVIERAPIAGFLLWTDSGAGARSVDLVPTGVADDAIPLEETGVPGNVVGYVDGQTGRVVIDMSLMAGPNNDIAIAGTIDYGVLPFNYGTEKTVTDDSAGNLIGDVDPAGVNLIDYDGTLVGWLAAGAFDFSYGDGAIPTSVVLGSRVLVSYEQQDFRFCANSRGAWGNDLEVRVYGSDEYYDADTGAFSRVDVEVWYDDPIEGALTLKESFTELVLDDPTNASYIVNVLNDTYRGSALIEFDATQAEDAFTDGINGRLVAGPNNVWGEAIAGGDGANTVFTATTNDTIIRRTLTIRYYDAAGVLYTITDDGDGNLEGDVNPAGTNTVDYDTGALSFTTSAVPTAPDPTGFPTEDGFLRAQYYADPSCGTYCSDAPSGGSDGVAPLSRSEVSSPTLAATNRGVYALNVPDELMNVAIPDFADDPTITLDLIAWAESRKDKFIIASVPQGATPTQAKNYKQLTLASYSSYCALYYPYLGVIDPVTELETFVAPSGWIAGVYARTDNNKAVSKAPAGVEDGALNLAVSLERNLALEEIGTLNPVGVNCLYESAETGRVVWGARTLSRDDFYLIQRRRFFMFVEKSVYRSTWGFVFETISAALYDRIRNLVSGFLGGLVSQGYFPTGIPSQAYLVVCDTSNNTQAMVDQGLVRCDVYLAPTTPGEFILFRFQQFVTAGT